MDTHVEIEFSSPIAYKDAIDSVLLKNLNDLNIISVRDMVIRSLIEIDDEKMKKEICGDDERRIAHSRDN